MAEKQILFLTGIGRSGTSMLQSMLHAHSQLHFSPETHFFKRHILPALLKEKYPTSADLESDKFLVRIGEERLDGISKMSFSEIPQLLEAFEKIIGVEDSQVNFLADKDTEYVRYLPHLKFLYPKAFLINIIRDPRDTIVSRRKTEWGKKSSLNFHIAEYQYYIKELAVLGPELFGDRYIEVRYEDLLQNPESALKKISDKLGIEYEPEMMQFYKKSSELVSASEKNWKGNISKPLDSSNLNKWNSNLTGGQAVLIQQSIEDFMTRNQYNLVEGKAALSNRLAVLGFKRVFRLKTWKERLKNG